MARLNFAQILPTDLYVEVEWKDYAPHSKRVTEDLPANVRAAITALMAADTTVRRWELLYIGPNLRARVLREGSSTPVNFPLTGQNLANATAAINWADTEVDTNLSPNQDKYQERRRLEREIDVLQRRLAAL